MAVSATSSPVVLLTNAVDPAKAAPRTTTNSNGDGGAGEFQQMLAKVSEDEKATAAAKVTDKSTARGAAGVKEATGEDGNTLPLLTDLLPSAPVVPSAAEGEAKLESDSTARKDSDDQPDNADQGVALLVLAPVLPQVPVVPANTQPAIGEVPAAALSAMQPSAPLPKGDTGAGSKNGAAIPAAANTDDALAIAATATKATSAAEVNPATLNSSGGDGAGAQGDRNNTDFADLLKQLDPSAAGPSTGSIDTGRTVQQADRAYQQDSPPGNPATATVSLPVASDGWHDAVADKVMWFGASKITSAEIHLNPPDLGPIQVRISTENDKASVYFTSQHASVREALDQALPRLRDMMGGQGIQLANAGVGGQGSSPQQQAYRGNPDGRSRPADGFLRELDDGAEPIGISTVASARLARSGIDAYA